MPSNNNVHVLIAGGGVGGLCLAQGLKKAGIRVTVFERDWAPDARVQGYRLNIEPHGSRALHACLPADLWNLLVDTAGDPGPRMGVFNEQLRELMQEDERGAGQDPVNAHHAVSRVTLRRLLLAGLEDDVQFDKQFVRYELTGRGDASGVTAWFADGTSATGTLLVGADGLHSRVRRQLLPDAGEIDTPAVGIGGKLPLTSDTVSWLPEHMTTTKNMILPPQDFLFTAAFRRRVQSPEIARASADRLRAIGMSAADLLHETENDYVMWAFVANRETFPRPTRPGAGQGQRQGQEQAHGQAQRSEEQDQRALREAIEARMKDWHPTLRRLIAETNAATVQAFDFAASETIKPWQTTNVTLLGDALHYMPPVGGMGGNAALHDAALLCRALQAVANGEKALVPALHECEAEMIEHGFGAVRASLLYTRLAISRFRPLRMLARSFFRVCGSVPALRRAVFED
jgi:2-polyprenyl-6-methoxyphenol hydroxylase-like FAD-dependent oxidoreductase